MSSENRDDFEAAEIIELRQSDSFSVPDCEDPHRLRAIAEAEMIRAIANARADVIRVAGTVSVLMLPLMTAFSFADSVINHYTWAWELNIAAIATGCLTALGGIMLFAFNTREKDK